MKLLNLSLILFLFLINNINSEEPQTQEPLKKKVIDVDLTYTDTGRKSQTIPLTGSNFDSLVQGGNNGRWLIIFYAETSKYCKKLKSLIDKIIEEKKYKSVNNIKFGSVDLDANIFLQVRFNITGIPFIYIIENNKMIEIPNFPSEENIIKYIETENFDSFEHTKNFEPDLSFYVFFKRLMVNSLSYLTRKTNQLLKKHNIDYQLGMTSCFLSIVFMCSIIATIIFILIIKCCEGKEVVKKGKEDKKEENIVNENNEEEKNNINNENNEEENKKIIEEKKEKEMKEKLNEENNKKEKEGSKKKEKKKKKE